MSKRRSSESAQCSHLTLGNRNLVRFLVGSHNSIQRNLCFSALISSSNESILSCSFCRLVVSSCCAFLSFLTSSSSSRIRARSRLSFRSWASTESTLSLSCLIAGPEPIQLFSAKRIPRRKTILRQARTPRFSGSEIIRGN